ncbi:MAG: serine/threonine-protein kinase [Balneolaceae bacterium]|nr:serine/threonine-protein kinase [Balneolaceae bacterium]
MNRERWQQIDSIVDRAITLDAEERTRFIERQCGDDPDLHREVIDLLEAIESSENLWGDLVESNQALLDNLTDTLTAHADPDTDTNRAAPLSQLGPYRLIRRIGRGGMGDVWLGERADGQFEQRVAVKIVRPETGLQEHYRRFQQERQILASLNHPNIAGLLDGGLTPDGRPYLVMEYVDGTPITDYCKERGCSLQQRLALFRQVCRAVQYAHRNLVVHRDLKPDNILVTEEGKLKVLDFGIAKLLDANLTDRTLIETRPGLRMMSLSYAAPEQVTLEPITTATDVYALGLLLYELLAGDRPFELKGMRLAEAENIIRHEDPQKASKQAVRWQKQLRGDLDAIILKALRKEPEKRYESAGQLLEDIDRYGKNLPVLARSDTFRYRSSKFLKRHRTSLAIAALIVLLSAGFGMYHTWQVTNERNIARTEAVKARKVTDFLIDVFEYSDPTTQNPDDITAREILADGAEYIRNSMEEQPETRAALMSAMGHIYTNLGMYDQAKPLLFKAKDINSRYASTSDLALTLHNLGDLYSELGMYDSAAVYLEESIALQPQSQDNTYLAGSMESLGWVRYMTGAYDKADSLYNAALRIQTTAYGNNSSEVANNLQLQAWVQHDLGHYDKADSLLRQALTLRRSLQGSMHKDVATILHSLGWILYQKKEYARSDSVLREALNIRRKIYPDGHMDLAWSLNNMGLIRQALGQTEEAEEYYTNALEMRKATLGEDHPHVAQSLGNLAGLYYHQQNFAKAASMFREVVEIDTRRLGENNMQVGIDYNNLATVLNNSGKKREAIKYYEKALSIVKQMLPASHPNVIRLSDNLADVHMDLGEYDRAEQLYLECFQVLREAEGLQNRFTQVISRRLAELYEITDRPDEASYYKSLIADESE